MAVTKTFNKRSIALLTNTTDANGKITTTRKTYGNIKESATNDQIYTVANSIKAILSKNIDEVQITDNSSLTEA